MGMTNARFHFHRGHLPLTCTPPQGRIRGKLVPDASGGTYDLTFLANGISCGGGTVVSKDGSPIECDFPHESGSGPKNVAVVITRIDDSAFRMQTPELVYLASAAAQRMA